MERSWTKRTLWTSWLLNPDVINNEEEYEVEAILSHKGPNGCRLYLTTWKGYPLSENTWEPEVNLRHAPILLNTYKLEHNLR